MAKPSWKERREKLKNKTKDSAENREGKASTILSFKALGDREVKWVDKVKHGREANKFDILPFEVSMDWYETMRKFSGKPTGLVPGDVDYKLEFAIHNGVGPEQQKTLCLLETFGLPCPVCEERARLLDNPEEDPDGKLAEGLKPKWRCLYNIIDLNADDEIRLWETSYHTFEKKLMTEVFMGDEGLDLFWDLEEGKTVEWRGKEKTFKTAKFVECDRIDFGKRAPYEDTILNEVFPLDQLLVIPTYEQLTSILTGGTGDITKAHTKNKEKNQKNEKKEDKESKETKEEKKPNRSSRFKKEEKQETEDEGSFPPDDNECRCPKKREFGVDFNQHPECNECADEDYNACEEAFNNPESESEPEPEPEPESQVQRRQRKPVTKEEESKPEPETTTRRRRR